MKRLFLSLIFASLGLFATTQAQTPAGYAIFGDVPDEYTDLTDQVEVSTTITGCDNQMTATGYTQPDPATISFTGHGLGNTYTCYQNVAVSIRFKSNQTLALTRNQAIHVKIRRTDENSAGGLEFAFIRTYWGGDGEGGRLGWEVQASSVTTTFDDVVLTFGGTSSKGTWSTNGKGNFANEENDTPKDVTFSGATTGSEKFELLRINALAGEAFEISQIYIDAEYVAPVEPLTPQDPKRYYFVRGGDLPVIDGVECVDLRATTYSAWGTNSITAPTLNENGASFTLPNSWFAADLRPKAQCMADVRRADWYLRMKFKTDASSLANQNLRINLSNSANNFHLTNDYGDGEWHDITFSLDDAANTLRSFPVAANDIAFQLHANESLNGSYFYIEYAYLTNDPDTDEKPAIVDNDAPTNFTVTEKPAATNSGSTTLQLYAEDEDTPITYTISYAVKNSGDTPTEVSVNGSQGSTVEKTISGLAPETTYTFSVVASDPNGNETSPVVLDITTAALAAQRYYLWRGDNSDIPSTGGLTSTLVNCNVTYSNNTFTKDTRIDKYLSQKTTSTWFALDVTPSETVENDIDNDWYLVVRFRTNMNNNVFFGNRLQFNFVSGGNNFNISNGEWITFNDGIWHTVSFRIGDHAGTLPPSYLTSGTLAFQLHIGSQVVAGEYLDIDYIYFTNDISDIDAGTQTRKRIALNDAEDNTSVLSANNGQTVDIDLTRSLTNASYNTLCLPFDLSSEQVEATFGAGTSIGQLTSARIKENDELYLNFSFVNTMEAGVPYIIQPENNVANPLIENVTIDNTLRPADFEQHVAFKGVFSPKEIEVQSADSYSILLLGANNTLSWPNTTANMKGMRAYFDLSTQASMIVRRASFGFHQEGQATGIGDVQESQQAVKVLRDGRVLIIRNNEVYDIFGARIQ